MKQINDIEVEDRSIAVTGILPGELYLGERNTGPKLFTCEKIENNCVYPREIGYPFFTWECVKVKN